MGRKGIRLTRRTNGCSPERAGIRLRIASLFKAYLEKENFSLLEFVKRNYEKFGYKDECVGRCIFNDLYKGRCVGQDCERGEGFPFRDEELNKYRTLFEIIGVSPSDKVVLKLKEKCTNFEYGDNKRRISRWNPQTPPVREIKGVAERRPYNED